MRARIVFLGMQGDFSLVPPRRALLVAGRPEAAADFAGSHGVPVLEVGDLSDPAALAALDRLAPSLVCAACFPRLLPRPWLERPALGCLNIHPSLLSAYRGPAPLFWQFRAGEERTGVTLHLMDEGTDTGDIVAQAEVPFRDGIDGAEADRLMAEAGARLLLEALALPALPRRPQPHEGASAQPRPSPADRRIPTTWSARRAFNFIRGAANWGPFKVIAGGERLHVHETTAFAADEVLGVPVSRTGREVRVQFNPGVVRLEAARKGAASSERF